MGERRTGSSWALARPVGASQVSGGRTLEKLLRSLHSDPSRLLDCCRQRIVFSEPKHLLECLEAVRGDRDVRVLRAENRLDEGFDSSVTAGYRDISLNLKIDTEETRQLGIETHICEVRLGLVELERASVSIRVSQICFPPPYLSPKCRFNRLADIDNVFRISQTEHDRNIQSTMRSLLSKLC